MSQFITTSFATPFRFDRIDKGGCIVICIREDILSKLLKIPYIYDQTECLTMKINLRLRQNGFLYARIVL